MNPIKNKGMFLETIINITNEKYNFENTCIVSKIPTNINLIKINQENQIINAFFQKSNNCDYIGCYQSHYFEFEAKETNKDYFDYKNLRLNQIEKMQNVTNQQGLAFLIIYFDIWQKFYLVDFVQLQNAIKKGKKIPFEWFEINCFELVLTNQLKLDYLPFLDKLNNW